MILYRYFAREVFASMLAVTALILVISMGWRFSGYLDQAASGVLTSDILLLVMMYRLPGFLEVILPISFFLAVMLTYGRLYVDSEMVVLESCGISPARLGVMTLVNAMIVAVLAAVVILWLKPYGEARVENLFASQKNLTEFDTLAPGRFQALRSGGRVTYTENLTSQGQLEGVFMNESAALSESGKTTTVLAQGGETVLDAQGNRFLVLKNGRRYSGRVGESDYQVIEYEEYGQRIQRQEESAPSVRRGAVPTLELLSETDPELVSELQWRVSMILMIPIVGLLAMPLAKVNPRQGRFTRLVPGMLLCFLYVVSLSAARSAVEKQQLPAGLGLWWVHVVFVGITAALFRIDGLSALLGRWLTPPVVSAEDKS